VRWILVDVSLAVLALLALGTAFLALYRHGKTLARQLAKASDAVSRATEGLAVTPPARATGAPVLATPARRGRLTSPR